MTERTCTIPGCAKPYLSRGWCQMHYSRWRRTGDPLEFKLKASDAIDRFNSRVEKMPNGCWIWQFGLSEAGYGRFAAAPHRYAHRFSYATFVAPIPDGLQIDHVCRVRSCVNPDHLRLADSALNHQNLSGARSDSRTGVRGVSRDGNGWKVSAHSRGVRYYGGRFNTLAEAEQAAIALRNSLFEYNELDRAE